jgi:hypothetical protein
MVAASSPIPSNLPLAGLGLSPVSSLGLLALVVAFGVAILVARRSYEGTVPQLSEARRRGLVLLRSAALSLLLLLVLEPVMTDRRSRDLAPTILLLVDDSASMEITDAAEGTRLAAARARLGRMRKTLARELPDARIEFAAGSRRVRVEGTADIETARAEGTDLRKLLVSAEQRHLEENLRAIVLFSDGRSTGRGAGGRSVNTPVFGVALGDSGGATDLRLDRIRYPSLVRQNDRLEIGGELVTQSTVAGSTVVELRRDGELIDSADLSWNPDTGRQPFQFVVTADSLGWQRLEVVARALDNEVLTQNNVIQIAYEVQKDRLRVLYYEARPTWNAHFLRRATQGDPRFEFWTAYLRADGMCVASAESTRSWPLPEAELADVDLFVAGSLSDYVELWKAAELDASVAAGAGLWVIAAGGAGTGIPRLSDAQKSFLPLRPRGRWRMTSGEYRAELTAEGRGHAMLQWGDAIGDPAQRFAQLPPFAQSLGPVDPSPDARVLLKARSGPWSQALFALRSEGQGTIAFWTGAPLWPWTFWRLGSMDNEDLFQALVDNVVSQLAEGSTRERLRLQLPARVVAVGSEAEVRATVLDPQYRPDDTRELWLEWTEADTSGAASEVRRLPMPADPDSPGGRRQGLPPLPPGEYRFRVATEEPDGPRVGEWTPLTVDAYSVEFRDPRPDVAGLRALTEGSGGRLLADDEGLSWLEQLDLSPRREVELSRFDLWSSWWALLPFLGLISCEWGLRRRWGLL